MKGAWKPTYRSYVLLILILTYIFAYVDRTVISTLTEPIKQEFGADDRTMGLLAGFVYTVPLALMLLPAGYIADRFSRRNILVITVMIWSILTMLSAFATSLWQLIVLRTIIAAAEAFFPTASQPLLADYYDKGTRSSALSRLFIAVGLASLIGVPLVANVAHSHGWRAGFIASGLPGLVLAIIFALTVREPARNSDAGHAHGHHASSLASALAMFRLQRSAGMILLGMMLATGVFIGSTGWMMPFLMRAHHLSIAEAGYMVSMTVGTAGVIGYAFGGSLVDRLVRIDGRWYAITPACCVAFALLGQLTMALASSLLLVGLGLFVLALSTAIITGPGIAVLYALMPPSMRGVISACIALLLSVVGAGLGPLAVGLLSDHFMPEYGNRSLTAAFLAMSPLQLLAFLLLLGAASRVRADLDRSATGIQAVPTPAKDHVSDYAR